MTTGTTNAIDRYVQVGDLNLHYLEWGQPGAPPVVMVHGLTGNAHAFDSLAANFATRSLHIRGRPWPRRQRPAVRRDSPCN